MQSAVANHGRVKYAHDHFSKPYLNDLSPGCWSCSRGTWACVFVGLSCTRQCFFCLRRQKEPKDFIPYVDQHIKLDSVAKLTDYLASFSFDGVSFSGGEPFLTFDRLLACVKAIRGAFGDKHYLWVYTNGDPVTEEKLAALMEFGLNELRMDISARQYDLAPLALALRYIPTVTVEIPAIPEDLDLVKGLLPRLDALGIKYLNLHQLMINDYNRSAFEARGYTEVHDERYHDWFPISESESAAMEILNYAAANDMRLGINYCSRIYKHTFQLPGFRRRYAPLCQTAEEVITATGYLRRMVSAPEPDCEAVRTPVDLLDPEGAPVRVLYLAPFLASEEEGEVLDRCEKHLEAWKACVGKGHAAEFLLDNQVAKLFFFLLFVEKKDVMTAQEEVAELYAMEPETRDGMCTDLLEFYQRFESYEHIAGLMPKTNPE